MMERHELDAHLNNFREKYGPMAIIIPDMLDLTPAFASAKGYATPKGWGAIDGEQRIVAGYIVKGVSLADKYVIRDGHVRYVNGRPRIKEWDDEMTACAVLCTLGMKNTTLKEVLGTKKGVQGFKPQVINKVIEQVRAYDESFSPEEDTLFLFAGEPDELHAKIGLNQIWLEQLLTHGAEASTVVEERERTLAAKLLDETVETSYRSAAGGALPCTGAFVAEKLAHYRSNS